MKETGGLTRSLTTVFVVVIVLIGFAAFFVSFLIAPLIVMVVSYGALMLVDRRGSRGG